MKKTVYTNTKKYTFDPTHKGAPYTFDGEHWLNAGEHTEAQLKHCKGFEASKDANTKWNEGSDIEQTATSVKSSGATLASDLKGEDMSEMLDRYFAEVHSTNWSFGIIVEDTLTEYNMNADEFREMLMTWASINERKVIRFKKVSTKMVKWLEDRVG